MSAEHCLNVCMTRFIAAISFYFQMSAVWMWIPAVFISFLMLHNAAAQSQMCEEPFQAVLTLVTNVTFPISANFLDPNHFYYREVLRFTEEEVDREREAAIQFFRDFYGLDFTNIEPNEQGQRILGNATFEPIMLPFNNTFALNTWLVNGNTRTRCFLVGDGGFRVQFAGAVMLHGEYGGDEGRLGGEGEGLFYGHDYLYDACALQGIIIQLESPAPIRSVQIDGFFVTVFRARNRVLGEGTVWGVGRVTPVNTNTLRFEGRQVFTFL